MATVETEDRSALTLSRLNRLPAFNETAVKLLARPFQDDDSIGVIESCFRSDPSLASQLLAAANSAAMGLRSRVSTLRHALAVLGIDCIRSLVVTIATSSYMRQFPLEVVRPIWSHGIATAMIAERLAGYSDRLCGAALYTAGLTHDLGRLGLLASDRHSYGSFLHDEYKDREQSEEIECDRFGVIHTVVGGILTQLWGFPEGLCGHAEIIIVNPASIPKKTASCIPHACWRMPWGIRKFVCGHRRNRRRWTLWMVSAASRWNRGFRISFCSQRTPIGRRFASASTGECCRLTSTGRSADRHFRSRPPGGCGSTLLAP
jgi:HD-like signal output (HDOD) protein